jgi:hypothetical protein
MRRYAYSFDSPGTCYALLPRALCDECAKSP